jgi:predicted ATP-grasp superfamily ATP-dependent carboligase
LEIEIEGLNKRAAKFSSEIKDLQDQIKAKEAGSHAQNLIEKYKSQQDNETIKNSRPLVRD